MLSSLRGYRRAWLPGDLSAALALFVIAVPEQLATSRLAGMPPIAGYYAFIAGALMFALLGASRHLSVGADSTVAPLIAAGIGSLAAVGSSHYAELAGLLAVCTGVLLVAVWLLRIGWIAEFLSAPIVTGFLAGVACVIVIHQLPSLLGVAASGGDNLHRLVTTLGELGETNAPTLAIGLGTLAIVLICQRLDPRIPGALIAMAAATAAVELWNLRDHGVAVLGSFAHGAPHLRLGDVSLSTLGQIAPLAGIVTLVIVTQSAATSRAFEHAGDGAADVGRDLLGVGAANALAGLIGSFPVNASPPRTAAATTAGGRSQAASLFAALLIAVLIPAAGVLSNVPEAALAGVLIAVAVRIFDLRGLIAIGRFSRIELALALITLLTVALVGVEQGIGVAVGLAILERTHRQSRPGLHVLGRIGETTSWAPLAAPEHPAEVPGVLVVLFATPLWYANATHFRTQLLDALLLDRDGTRVLVLDALGMSDIDFTGARALSDALDELDRKRIVFGVARAGETLRHGLEAAGLLARIGSDHLFAAVDEAVTALTRT